MDILQQKYLKILLIGDSCLDVYHYGSCNRISPEAPVLILKKTESKTTEGMAGNVKNNLERMNNKVFLYTNSEKIIKNRYIDSSYNQHLLRVDEGECSAVKKLNVSCINTKIRYDALIISDYDKGFVSRDVAKYLCKIFKDIPIFVDTKKSDISCFSNCFIKINKKEYDNIQNFGKNNSIITTLGSSGAIHNGNIFPTKKVDVFDVCGAGDVFLSALASFYLRCGDISRSIKLSNICASYSVSKPGTYPLDKNDLIKIGVYDDLCI